jgi:GNAT superfamily N-acetyltransferase
MNNIHHLRLDEHPSDTEREYLDDQINAFNVAQTGKHDYQPLAFVLRDDENVLVAGIAGWTWAGGCEIRSLWVAEAWRGHGLGTRLLALAEQEATRRGCKTVVLDTHSFQAPNFYVKQGYLLTGVVDDYPPGARRYFFHKRLGY